MIKKHILPAIAGVLIFLILWGLLGQILSVFELPNKVKGFVILVGSVVGGVLVNNFLSKRASDKQE